MADAVGIKSSARVSSHFAQWVRVRGLGVGVRVRRWDWAKWGRTSVRQHSTMLFANKEKRRTFPVHVNLILRVNFQPLLSTWLAKTMNYLSAQSVEGNFDVTSV